MKRTNYYCPVANDEGFLLVFKFYVEGVYLEPGKLLPKSFAMTEKFIPSQGIYSYLR